MSFDRVLDPATADTIYQTVIDMHTGLDDTASAAVNARMILILANYIGDPKIITEAATIARGNTENTSAD